MTGLDADAREEPEIGSILDRESRHANRDIREECKDQERNEKSAREKSRRGQRWAIVGMIESHSYCLTFVTRIEQSVKIKPP